MTCARGVAICESHGLEFMAFVFRVPRSVSVVHSVCWAGRLRTFNMSDFFFALSYSVWDCLTWVIFSTCVRHFQHRCNGCRCFPWRFWGFCAIVCACFFTCFAIALVLVGGCINLEGPFLSVRFGVFRVCAFVVLLFGFFPFQCVAERFWCIRFCVFFWYLYDHAHFGVSFSCLSAVSLVCWARRCVVWFV